MKLRNASAAWRLVLGAAAAVSALTLEASAARALTFHDGDLLIAITKNNTDALYDFGSVLTPGTSRSFALTPVQTSGTFTGLGFPAGASGALSEGAVVNALGVPSPGLTLNDGNFGPVPVGTLLFSTTVSNPGALINDTAIGNAASFLQSTAAPAASGWLPSTGGYTNLIAVTSGSAVLPTSRTGAYSSSTGPGNGGQDTISGNLPFKTSATLGAGGGLLLNLYDATQGYQSIGGTLPSGFTQAATLQFSESAGILTVTVVPEPGTMLLLGAGLLGLVSFGRRRT